MILTGMTMPAADGWWTRHPWSDRNPMRFQKSRLDGTPSQAVVVAGVGGEGAMINRSAVVISHEPAFVGWLRGTGLAEEAIRRRNEVANKTVYLIPACFYPEELHEVIEDFYEEIFRQELQAWQPDEAYWPDTAHFGLFNRWFRVEAYSEVRDAGRGAIEEETL